MRIAIAGKGGTGKTTIAGTLARVLGQSGRDVLAVDADSNPNLAMTLGLPGAPAPDLLGLPRNLLTREPQPDGTSKVVFAADPEQVLADHALQAPDGVRLVVMGRVGHGGAG